MIFSKSLLLHLQGLLVCDKVTPLFKNWITLDVFNNSGKIPSVIDLSNIRTNEGIISSYMYFIIEILKMSNTDFLLWSMLISVAISISSVGFMKILSANLFGR